jgi:hypothetical protein
MENLIACSLVDMGIKCGETTFTPLFTYQLGVMCALIFGAGIGALIVLFACAYEEKEFKKKMRDLGYGHILGELNGASEKWIPGTVKKAGKEVS